MTFVQFLYGIRMGIKGVKSHRTLTFASIITTAACLVLICALFVLSMNVKLNLDSYEAQSAMIAFVSDSLTRQQAQSLQQDIEGVDGVKTATFVTREEAYNEYTSQFGSSMGSVNSHIEPSVFRDRYKIELASQDMAESVGENVSNIRGIADVKVDVTVANGFAAIQRGVNVFGIFVGAMLFIICTIIMMNTIKLTILARQEEIEVMKMMGAYRKFIKLPFMCEGCCVSCIGSLLAFAVISGMYPVINTMMGTTGIMSLITLLPYTAVSIPVFAASMIIGLGIGCCGSAFAIRQHIKF